MSFSAHNLLLNVLEQSPYCKIQAFYLYELFNVLIVAGVSVIRITIFFVNTLYFIFLKRMYPKRSEMETVI